MPGGERGVIRDELPHHTARVVEREHDVRHDRVQSLQRDFGEDARRDRRRVHPSGCNASDAATTAAQNFLNADERDEFMVLLLGCRRSRMRYLRNACAYCTVLRGPSTRTVTR